MRKRQFNRKKTNKRREAALESIKKLPSMMTDWEREFSQNVLTQYKITKDLTVKQWKVIYRIADKVKNPAITKVYKGAASRMLARQETPRTADHEHGEVISINIEDYEAKGQSI